MDKCKLAPLVDEAVVLNPGLSKSTAREVPLPGAAEHTDPVNDPFLVPYAQLSQREVITPDGCAVISAAPNYKNRVRLQRKDQLWQAAGLRRRVDDSARGVSVPYFGNPSGRPKVKVLLPLALLAALACPVQAPKGKYPGLEEVLHRAASDPWSFRRKRPLACKRRRHSNSTASEVLAPTAAGSSSGCSYSVEVSTGRDVLFVPLLWLLCLLCF